MNRRLACVVLALVSLVAIVAVGVRVARAADDPVRLPLTAADIPAPHVDWHGLYQLKDGAKVGWMRIEFGRSGDGTFAAFAMHMSLTAMGKPVEIDASERSEFDGTAPFAFRGGSAEMTQNGAKQTVEVVKGKDGFTARSVQGGQTNSPPVPGIDYTLADYLAAELWFQKPRAVGDTLRANSFSVMELMADVDALTVTSRKESAALGVPTVFYEAAMSSDLRGHEGVVRIDAHGKLLSVVIGGAFEARLEPEETAKKVGKGGDVFVFGMAPLDQPIGPAPRVTRLVLDVDGDGAKSLADGPRQVVARDAKTGAVMLSLGTGFGVDEPVPQKEIDEALAETVGLPIRSPEVVALAAQAVGEAKTPREKVDRLVHFVSEYVKDELCPGDLSVAEIIAQKKGDCSEHSHLFAALARTAGVPARQVSGLMYMGDDVRSFGGHAWDEVVLDGKWVPVDPTWNETVLDAAHVTTEREGKGGGSADTFGKLKFRLKAVEHAK